MPTPYDYEIAKDDRGWFLTYNGYDMYPDLRFATYAEAEETRLKWLLEDEEAVTLRSNK